MSERKPDLATLVRQLAEAAGVAVDAPANDEEEKRDVEEAIALAKLDAADMRRARKR